MSKVFSVTDFKEGLDTRKTPLTAPGGTLRILENAVINQGGEIEKRLAFVHALTITPTDATYYLFGQGTGLHVFHVIGELIGVTPHITMPVDVTVHGLVPPVGDTITKLIDVEAFNDKFQVCGIGASGRTYVWYDGSLLHDPGLTGPVASGTFSRTYKTKMYRTDGVYLRFSGVNDPAETDPASVDNPGAGFINLAINDPDGETLQGMEIYYQSMAVFARLLTQIWALDPDPTKDAIGQQLRIGTVAPHSIQQFGTGDVLFLSDAGVRSLKAIYVNLAAGVSDVGSSIDPIVRPVLLASPADAPFACAVIEPVSGRYWLFLKDTIYVLSHYPAGDITAWSTFTIDFVVVAFARVENYIFALDTEGRVLLYGGEDRNTYDPDMLVRVRTPHMSADAPTENKRIQSIDVMCMGQWSLSVGMLPNNLDAFELCATIVDNTYGLKSIPFAGYGTHFGLHMEHQGPGPAVLAAIHLNLQEGVTK